MAPLSSVVIETGSAVVGVMSNAAADVVAAPASASPCTRLWRLSVIDFARLSDSSSNIP
ncbi:Uncharacterised protein [Mycobacterium tuberculosis]|nr:Uncharacterised protein [Mycobacterium tuberculosis]